MWKVEVTIHSNLQYIDDYDKQRFSCFGLKYYWKSKTDGTQQVSVAKIIEPTALNLSESFLLGCIFVICHSLKSNLCICYKIIVLWVLLIAKVQTKSLLNGHKK